MTTYKEYQLSELTGTEKQIAWAEEIRQKRIANSDSVYKGQLDNIISVYNTETSAKFWIETREELPVTFMRNFAEAARKIKEAKEQC